MVLVGPTDVSSEVFDAIWTGNRKVVAADGGAARALEFGTLPDAVIGDFDSFQPDTRIASALLHKVAEQDSTDFEKCLDRIEAPLVLAVGFLGDRTDHSLAVLSTLVQRPPGGCVLIGTHDVIVHCPARLSLDLPQGTRVSLFPLTAVTGRSTGLHWPIESIAFDPMGRIGTSNVATGPVDLEFDGPGMLLSLPPAVLPRLLEAL